MDLMDSSQNISVLTNEFIRDIGTARVLDAVKYVAGIGVSINPELNDRMMIRGFLDSKPTIDGFTSDLPQNTDPVIIERIEVIKGPNAIIAPSGTTPGGLVNNVTKRPLFTNKGSLSYQVGRFNYNRVEMDANYVVRPDKLAVRVVGAFTDTDTYMKHGFNQNITVMPMLTYRISPTTELTVQVQAANGAVINSGSILSVYAVGRNNIRHLDGAPRNFGMLGRNMPGHGSYQMGRFFFTSKITDKLSTRVSGRWSKYKNAYHYLTVSAPLDATGANAEVVKLNPITGKYEWDGVTFNDNPRFTLAGGLTSQTGDLANLQNDFVFEHSGTSWKSQTIAGWALNYQGETNAGRRHLPNTTLYDFTDPNYTPPDSYTFAPNWQSHASLRTRTHQAYLYQIVNLFDDHLVLSGSVSQNRYFNDNNNNLTPARIQQKTDVTLLSGGVVYKVNPGVSLFYGYSEQEILGAPNPITGIPAHTRPSRQHEGGVRVKLFDGRLYATLSYFDILQDNLYTQDWRNFQQPYPTLPYPATRTNFTSKGFEFEFTWAPTKNFSVIGSYTDFEIRDADNMRRSNVAERTAAIWGSYTFSETGPLHGLTVGLGANYVGDRPSDNGPVYTSPPLGFAPVRAQPQIQMPSYILAEAHASYRFNKHWKAQLTIHNLLNKEYVVYYIRSFRGVGLSTPINPKLSIRYEF